MDALIVFSRITPRGEQVRRNEQGASGVDGFVWRLGRAQARELNRFPFRESMVAKCATWRHARGQVRGRRPWLRSRGRQPSRSCNITLCDTLVLGCHRALGTSLCHSAHQRVRQSFVCESALELDTQRLRRFLGIRTRAPSTIQVWQYVHST